MVATSKQIYDMLLSVFFLINTHLRTTKSLLGWGGIRLRTYWNTSVCLSNVSHTFHCSRSTSHRWRSRSTRFSTTDGGASTSTDTRQRLKGFPSPTLMGDRQRPSHQLGGSDIHDWDINYCILLFVISWWFEVDYSDTTTYEPMTNQLHHQRRNTNLLIVEFCVIRAAARHPVFGLFPGLFKQVLKSPLHMCLVCSVIIFQLFAQLANCWCMQVSFHVWITRLSNHLMRDLMDA